VASGSGQIGSVSDIHKVGDIAVRTVADGHRTFPLPDDFIRNAGRVEINEALAEAGMPPDEMTIVFNPVLLESSGRRILIDTGNGPGDPGATAGYLMANLAGAGIDPAGIDLVVISHFHGDHINGLVAKDGSAAFPNAAISVPEREWDFWMDEGERSRAPAGRMQQLFGNVARVFGSLGDRVSRFAWDREVAPGITAVGTPGHTPGHTSFAVSSGCESLFVQSDVTNHPALFVRRPGWRAQFDQDPAMAEATRRRVYEMLVSESMPVQGFHFPFPSRGRAERTRDGYRLVPLAAAG
jgi:glyoxylase-like metal-dependent hydrolase (beta-lactamase superfamily II)